MGLPTLGQIGSAAVNYGTGLVNTSLPFLLTGQKLPEFGLSERLADKTVNYAGQPNYTAPATEQNREVAPEGSVPTNDQNGSLLGAFTTAQQQQAAQAAQYAAQNDAAINAGIGRLDLQRQTGQQNILGAYQSAYDRLMGQKGADLANLGQQRTTAMQGNQTARDNIGASVRNQNQGLQRLLGARGAGNSSAASILAPFAAAQQGNIQRSQVQQAYGQNMSGLDQAENATNIGYENSFGDLNAQKANQEQQLNQGIEQNRASLLSQRSDAANNQAAINAILDSVARLGINTNFTPKAVQVQAPNLAKYDYAQASGPSQNPGVSDAAMQAAGPFFSLLNPQKKQQTLGA